MLDYIKVRNKIPYVNNEPKELMHNSDCVSIAIIFFISIFFTKTSSLCLKISVSARNEIIQ